MDAVGRAVRREHPGTAGPGAVDPAVHVHLHAVGHAVRLVGRHVGEDPPPHHGAAGVELERVDVLGPARVGDVERALVRREGQPVGILAIGHHRGRAVRRDAIDPGIGKLALREGHAQAGIGEVDAPVGAADDVVRAVEALALPAVHQDLAAAIARPARHPTVAALADDQPPLQVKRRAVALAGVVAYQLGRLAGRQPVQRALADVDESVEALRVPQRPLGEAEAGGEALGRGRVEDRGQGISHGVSSCLGRRAYATRREVGS